MLIDTAWLLVIFSSAHLLGIRLLSFGKFTWHSRLDHVLNAIGVGLILYSCAVSILGLLGGLYTWLGFGLIGLSVLIGWRGWRELKASVNPMSFTRPSVIDTSLIILFLIAVLLHYFSATVPLIGTAASDDVAYQVAVPRVYTAYHHFVLIAENIRSFIPMNINMLYTLGILLDGNEVSKLINFAFGLGVFMLTYDLTRQYIDSRFAFLAGLLCYVNPLISHNSTHAYIGLGMTFYFLLSFRSLLRWHTTGESRLLILSSIFIGFNIGSQYLGLVLATALSPFFLINLDRIYKSWRSSCLAVGIILVIGGSWYLKNWIVSGNPFLPLFPDWTSIQPINEINDATRVVGLNSMPTLAGLISLPWTLTMKGNWFGYWGGMGHLFLVYGPLFIGISIKSKLNPISKFSMISTIIMIAIWYEAKGVVIRHLVFVVPLIIIFSITVIKDTWDSRLLKYIHLIALMVAIGFGFVALWKDQNHGLKYVFQPLSKASYLSQNMDYYDSSLFLNKMPGEVLVFLSGSVFPIYLDVPSIGPYRNVYSPLQPEFDETNWFQTPLVTLKEWKVTHILDVSGRFMGVRQLLQDDVYFEEVFVSGDSKIYAIH
jgi:hypothetical protein